MPEGRLQVKILFRNESSFESVAYQCLFEFEKITPNFIKKLNKMAINTTELKKQL